MPHQARHGCQNKHYWWCCHYGTTSFFSITLCPLLLSQLIQEPSGHAATAPSSTTDHWLLGPLTAFCYYICFVWNCPLIARSLQKRPLMALAHQFYYFRFCHFGWHLVRRAHLWADLLVLAAWQGDPSGGISKLLFGDKKLSFIWSHVLVIIICEYLWLRRICYIART